MNFGKLATMKKQLIFTMVLTILFSGCTQIVTAPIKVAGAAVSTTIDVAGSAVHAVTGSDDEEEEK